MNFIRFLLFLIGIISILFKFICISSTPLYPASLKEGKNFFIYDCNNKQINSKDNALAWDIFLGIIEALEKSKNCLPKKYYDDIINSLKKRKLIFFLNCNKSKNCGKTMQSFSKGLYIELFFESIYIEGACGCVEAIILHELLHWGAGLSDSNKDERIAYGCEEKCFTDCAKDRKGIGPEDCCENKK